jgi:hypothetical protein
VLHWEQFLIQPVQVNLSVATAQPALQSEILAKLASQRIKLSSLTVQAVQTLETFPYPDLQVVQPVAAVQESQKEIQLTHFLALLLLS